MKNIVFIVIGLLLGFGAASLFFAGNASDSNENTTRSSITAAQIKTKPAEISSSGANTQASQPELSQESSSTKASEETAVSQSIDVLKVAESANIDNLTELLSTIKYNNSKGSQAYDLENEIANKFTELELEGVEVSEQHLACDDTHCMVMFSAASREQTTNGLYTLSENENLGRYINGGLLRTVEEKGRFYGVIAGPSISADSE